MNVNVPQWWNFFFVMSIVEVRKDVQLNWTQKNSLHAFENLSIVLDDAEYVQEDFSLNLIDVEQSNAMSNVVIDSMVMDVHLMNTMYSKNLSIAYESSSDLFVSHDTNFSHFKAKRESERIEAVDFFFFPSFSFSLSTNPVNRKNSMNVILYSPILLPCISIIMSK